MSKEYKNELRAHPVDDETVLVDYRMSYQNLLKEVGLLAVKVERYEKALKDISIEGNTTTARVMRLVAKEALEEK